MGMSVEELRCSALLKLPIQAADGEIGSLSDILFDDGSWSIRYFVVKTGGWLSGREVLLISQAVNRSELPRDMIPVELTKEQVQESPDIKEDPPVSKQQDTFSIPLITPPSMGISVVPGVDGTVGGLAVPGAEDTSGDPHLRSAKEMIGYRTRTPDAVIGKVEDFTIDWQVMRLTSLLVSTGNGDAVSVPIDSVRRLSWEDQEVVLHGSPGGIETAPV